MATASTRLDEVTTFPPDYEGGTYHGVEWDTYCRLCDDESNNHYRMIYLDGTLTIMSPGVRHEFGSNRLYDLVKAVTRAWRIRNIGVGTTTLRREGRTRLEGAGKEPDQGFYIGDDVAHIRGQRELDLSVTPPPTLAIEVDDSVNSARALAAYARIGVPEVWIYKVDEPALWFGRLVGDRYEEVGRSIALPRLTPALVLEAVAARDGCGDDLEWDEWLERWARDLPEPPEA